MMIILLDQNYAIHDDWVMGQASSEYITALTTVLYLRLRQVRFVIWPEWTIVILAPMGPLLNLRTFFTSTSFHQYYCFIGTKLWIYVVPAPFEFHGF